jgi:hypothetical protein
MQSGRKNLKNINYCFTSRYSSAVDCCWEQLFGDMTYIKHRRNDKGQRNFFVLERWEDILKNLVEAAKYNRIINARTISDN